MTCATSAALLDSSSAIAIPLPATPTVVVIGGATLYLGDSYSILPRLGWIDVLVTDPPYEFRAEGGGHYREARKSMDQILAEELSDGFDHSIINPLLVGSVIVFCHNDQLPKLLRYIDGNFERQAVCIWRKKNPQPVANKHYRPVFEFYIHAWNRGAHPRGTLLDLDREIVAMSPRGDAKFGHPTVKPDAVMDKIITNVAPGLICDPFMGTGSTGVAAVKAGRQFIGIEKNPTHFATACTRLAAAQGLATA
jgi:site-specific DNA-methyltransferase (adenine-specific)